MNDANLYENIAVPENSITRLTEEINALKAEREKIKPNYKETRIGLIISFILALSSCLFTSVLLYLMEAKDTDMPLWQLCFIPAIILAGFFGVFLMLYFIEKVLFNRKINQIDNAIAEKEKELQHNQNLQNKK
jgi:hypothetical protein